MPSTPQTPLNPSPPDEIQSFLSSYPPHVQAIALTLRSIVLSAAPHALEQVDLPARMLAYGFKNTYKDMICVIMPLKHAANLGFSRGSTLLDPQNLLQGTGKRARHVKIASPDEIDVQALLALLQASIAQIR